MLILFTWSFFQQAIKDLFDDPSGLEELTEQPRQLTARQKALEAAKAEVKFCKWEITDILSCLWWKFNTEFTVDILTLESWGKCVYYKVLKLRHFFQNTTNILEQWRSCFRKAGSWEGSPGEWGKRGCCCCRNA